MVQSMAWHNVLYCSPFLFGGQTVLCVKTSFIFSLLRGKSEVDNFPSSFS